MLKREYESRQAEKHFSRKEKVFGQYWTPYPLARFIVEFCSKLTKGRDILIDPACGEGVFLKAGSDFGFRRLVGIDIDPNVVTKLEDFEVMIMNALEETGFEGKCDVVVGNPPFSAKYGKIADRRLLERFELGRGRRSQAIEILFLEKFVELAKEGGAIGIILPFGIFANTQLSYVRKFILENVRIFAIISLPRNIFPGTTSKTCVLLGVKGRHEGSVLVAKIERLSDLSNFEKIARSVNLEGDILYPEYYIDRISLKTDLRLGDVVDLRSGATEYGKRRIFSESGIPFISAKVVTDLGLDFSRDRRFVPPGSIMDKKRARVEVGDILFVRVGVGCIGRTAVVTDDSEKGVADDWVYILRVKDRRVSPYYVAFYLQTETIQKEIRRLARGVGTITIPKSCLQNLPFVFDERLNEMAKEVYLKMLELRKAGRITEAQVLRRRFLKMLDDKIKS